MSWKRVVGMLAGVGVVIAAVVLRHRRRGVETLAPVSSDWIADHVADRNW